MSEGRPIDVWLEDPEVRRWWHDLPVSPRMDRFATLRRLGRPSEDVFTPHRGRLADEGARALAELDPLAAAVLTLRDLSGLDAARSAELLALDEDELELLRRRAQRAWTEAVARRLARLAALRDVTLGPPERLVLRHALVAALRARHEDARAPRPLADPSVTARRRDAERVVLDTPWETVLARLQDPHETAAPPDADAPQEAPAIDTLTHAYARLEQEHPPLAAILLLRDVEALSWETLSEQTGLTEDAVRRVHAQARALLDRLLEDAP